MKINLLNCSSDCDCHSGYLNIDPYALDNDPLGRVKCELDNLDQFVDDGEAESILALNILDYIPYRNADKFLRHWLSKLAYGGTLTISFTDIRELSRYITKGVFSPEDINNLVHGMQIKEGQTKLASYSLEDVVEMLENMGYKILKKRLDDISAIIVVRREGN